MVQATSRRRVGLDLTEGPIFKILMVFSVPIILTNLIQQLYSLVDLIIVGQYVGSIGTVGVSTGGEIADFMTPLATAFSMSGQIYISQLIGSGQKNAAKRSIGTLFTIMLIFSAVIAVLTVALSDLKKLGVRRRRI